LAWAIWGALPPSKVDRNMKLELIDRVNGNDLGRGPAAQNFFHLRGYANRRPGQSNVGDCMLWHALEQAADESGNTALLAEIQEANRLQLTH
jgi:hypothetical protein